MSDKINLAGRTAIRDGVVLRRVSQLGSARSGLAEWRLQRLTALALIPLGLYFVGSVLRLITSNHDTAAAWLASPVNALLMLLFVLSVFAHAFVGLRSIYADYVHGQAALLITSLVTRGLMLVLAAAGTLAVLKLFLGYRGAP